MTTIYCPRCDSRHDPAGAPWCAQPHNVPAVPEIYGTLGTPALQLPAAESGGPAPGDLELFEDHGRTAPLPAVAEAAHGGEGVGAELVPVRPRARHRRYKRRSRRLAGLAAAGMTVLSGGLLAANAMGGGGGARTDEAVARADTPVQPLPSEEPGNDDGATPDGDRPSGAAKPDGAEPAEPRTGPTKAARDADRPAKSPAPTKDSPEPTATTPAEGRVTAPDTAEPESSSPSTGTPTPTPSNEGDTGTGGDNGGSNGSGDSGDSGGGSTEDPDRGGLELDLPLLNGLL
ncbi:hypothetical protein [Streptomyces sp. CMB-StM0423]|uniref:hypothetical protein n=1 Tax=Streptomyces sp. CMB-StM0423 TaxID=2059884 RepID=UPI000C702461|nr:hypothetical protein [Streptomyces sp. CMB-StM0423]AUH42050.1 hypothetical protein CXR04_19195 [Streptomyces sp. CMB-StM0423]